MRLTAGARNLDEEFRRQHVAYLAAVQRKDGGFAGRQGNSDLYYTSFALRGLALLGALDEPAAAKAAAFLEEQLGGSLPSIDFLSLVYSAVLLHAAADVDVFTRVRRDRREMVARTLEPFRRDDGGFAKTKAGRSSTYHTFLSVACRQLVGLPPDEPERTIALIRSRRRDDGGFVEIEPLRQSGTNPTSAAVGLLRMLNGMNEQIHQDCTRFLARMQTAEGGLRANTRIPVADQLSTFTGLVALADLDALDAVDLDAAARYAKSLALPDGGFRGGAWDYATDVEYTFYGLGTLALLST
jgi:geranylgeranyl transferase type-2 subunit beta